MNTILSELLTHFSRLVDQKEEAEKVFIGKIPSKLEVPSRFNNLTMENANACVNYLERNSGKLPRLPA